MTIVSKSNAIYVMVENIPPLLRSDRALQVFFDRMFPRGVHSAAVCLNIDTLIDLCDRRARVRERLALCRLKEESSDEVATHTTCDCVVPTLRNWPLFCCKRRRLPSVETYRSELQRLDRASTRNGSGSDARTTMRKRDDQLGTRAHFQMFSSGRGGQNLSLSSAKTRTLHRLSQSRSAVGHDVASEGDDNSTSAFDPMEEEETRRQRVQNFGATTLRRAADVSMGVLASSGNFVGRSAATMVHRAAVGVSVVGRIVEDIALGSDSCSTGFVTFRRLEDAATASQVLLSPIPDSLDTTVAPQPRDLIWENVAVPKTQVETRTMLVDIALGVGAILWSTIVSFIYFLGSLDTLSKLLTFLNEFKDSALYISVQGWLPGMLLLAVIALLPGVRLHQRAYERTKLRSQIEKTFCRYFIYNMSNIYVTVIVGSIFEDLKHIIDHPQELMNTLAASIPKVAVYFTFDHHQGNLGTRLGDAKCRCLLVWHAVSKERYLDASSPSLVEKTEDLSPKWTRRKRRRTQRSVARASRGMLFRVTLIAWRYSSRTHRLSYVVLFPLLLPFGCLYFALSWCVRRFRAPVFHTPAYESGGELFYKVFDRTIVGLSYRLRHDVVHSDEEPFHVSFLFPILM